MLGGSFWIAMVRNGISTVLMLSVFLLLDVPRFDRKKTILCYVVYGLVLIGGFSVWYLYGYDSYMRLAGFASVPTVGIFCGLMSRERVYLSLYRVSFVFYLMALCVFVGIDASRLWFGGSVWADIFIRIVIVGLHLLLVIKKMRAFFLDNIDLLQREMDFFSVVTLIMSLAIAGSVAYWPASRELSVSNITRIFVVMFLAGLVQYTILHLYIHIGREHVYEEENRLLAMQEQFLRFQLELASGAEQETARIRHDIRHHLLLIRDYAQKGEMQELLGYLEQYMEDVKGTGTEYICGNRVVNSILAVYARHAREKGIRVDMDVDVEEGLAVRDIDFVAILANIFENAVHGSLRSNMPDAKIGISIGRKGHKIVIQCRNTSASGVKFRNGLPVSEKNNGIGVLSIMKTVSRYGGEADFAMEDGMFVVRILLNLPASYRENG